MRRWVVRCSPFLGVVAALLAGQAPAATLCVNQTPSSGCAYTTIGAAIAGASAGDTITVAPGIYNEGVHITIPLSLVGAGAAQTAINATGQSNGIFIDGTTSAGGPNTLNEVTVTGFTVENANFEGILVANASSLTLARNRVVSNDLALHPGATDTESSCPGLTSVHPFETDEAFDCGEGVHLIGVDHSTVTDNIVAQNAGGILLTDETGPTHNNLIEGNRIADNAYDCGITLASHPPAAISRSSAPLGVFGNVVANNESSKNGLAVGGAGAGVGLFAPGPHNRTSGNVVIGNRLVNNGLPGVAIHNHAPTQNIDLADNIITGNYIAGNGPDSDVGTMVPTGISVSGVSSISGAVISRNVFARETDDIAVNNAGATVDVHLNNFDSLGTGVANLGTGTVNATENWWGCPRGPGGPGCAAVSGSNVLTTPFLSQPIQSAGG